MKVLITGANGQLGGEVVDAFNDIEVVATDQSKLDITNKVQVKKIVSREKPDWIIHCAAWTDVEGCAQNPQKALEINGEATKNLAEVAKAVGAKMVYISTNEVFDGKKSNPYSETEQTNPINAYAVSKLAGEKYVQEILKENWVIVRTSWVYGPKGKSNFPLKIIAAADKLKELKVVNDEIAIPTYAPDLAGAIKQLVEKNVTGIFHLVNEGLCSRYEWAVQVLENSGRGKIKVEPIKLKDYPRKSTPPSYGILANIRAKEIGIELPRWQTGLNRFFEARRDLLAQ